MSKEPQTTKREEYRIRAAYCRLLANQVRRSVFYTGDREKDAREWEAEAGCLESCNG